MNNPTVRFKKPEGRNALLKVGKLGGAGFIRDPHCNIDLVNDPASVHASYLRQGK